MRVINRPEQRFISEGHKDAASLLRSIVETIRPGDKVVVVVHDSQSMHTYQFGCEDEEIGDSAGALLTWIGQAETGS